MKFVFLSFAVFFAIVGIKIWQRRDKYFSLGCFMAGGGSLLMALIFAK